MKLKAIPSKMKPVLNLGIFVSKTPATGNSGGGKKKNDARAVKLHVLWKKCAGFCDDGHLNPVPRTTPVPLAEEVLQLATGGLDVLWLTLEEQHMQIVAVKWIWISTTKKQ